jgi:hypothetical protein
MMDTNLGEQALFAQVLLDPDAPCPSGMRAWNDSDPIARLAIHRNSVVSSLIDALADTFPVAQELVGSEFFRAMASIFARQSPPSTRVLAHYGGAFPAFIESFAPAQSVPYLADIARLEMARVRAYHSGDTKPMPRDVVGLALASGERMGELRLVCHPSVSVVTSKFAIYSLWAAHQGEGHLGSVDPDSPESALVVRQGLDVLVVRLQPGAAQFIAAIQSGIALGEAAAIAIGRAETFDLTQILGLLMAHGALTSIHLPQRLDS